jgi:large subunit ribosomal protein L25
MSKLTLKTQKRDSLGKKNQDLRKQGIIPGVVYGRKTHSLALQMNLKEFISIYHQAGDTDLIDLVIEDEGKEKIKKVLVQDVQVDHLYNQPLHVDFYEVEMDKPVTTYVPLIFVGESPAVQTGGVLVKSMDEIEIEALPMNLPHSIDIDIVSLDQFDKTIYVRDIKPPEGVKFLVKENTPIITVSAPITEEELEAELGTAKTVEEVEVEGEKEEAEEEKEVDQELKEESPENKEVEK